VVRHEATQLSAVLNLDLAVSSGERFAVDAVTSEDWIIDSVDTAPPDLLEERQFIPAGGRKFTLHLARPLTSKERTRLVIRAHRQLPAEGEAITAPALRLVEFQDLREEQLVVALRATDSSREFQLSGDLDLFRMDPESAGPEELSLLETISRAPTPRITTASRTAAIAARVRRALRLRSLTAQASRTPQGSRMKPTPQTVRISSGSSSLRRSRAT